VKSAIPRAKGVNFTLFILKMVWVIWRTLDDYHFCPQAGRAILREIIGYFQIERILPYPNPEVLEGKVRRSLNPGCWVILLVSLSQPTLSKIIGLGLIFIGEGGWVVTPFYRERFDGGEANR